ncbi:hypothetical protein [Microbispora rosea]|jgi:hypothetical protein|uniref:Tryptophan-associated transmembrane protein (Trp_oprn_chp) n=1 Tax=Microbispora rosea TaxID=58117 RepID=A0A1N7D5H0_9ACTN|nr:hypothetical protein [Microbispora rosea]GIH48929.1 hypothetical protein Mro03_41080 [Microbispora rosea subsp. rosea]SIR71024.1 hypothetical protein SAMN05421833_113144 [Microbispora rosea]
MRHFFGLLLGVVVAAALLLGGGWASQEAVRGAAQSVDPAKDTRMLIALGVMAVVGLLLGLVLVGRVSPLATFVPSMALLAWTVVYVLDVSRAASLVPSGPSVQAELLQAGRGMLMLLSTGVYGLLGVALFLPVLMPSRWARPEPDEEQEEYEESYGF